MADASSKISLIAWIMLALLVWGGVLAAGSYFYGQSMLWQRAAIVLGSALLFVGFWLVMLTYRQRRLPKE